MGAGTIRPAKSIRERRAASAASIMMRGGRGTAAILVRWRELDRDSMSSAPTRTPSAINLPADGAAHPRRGGPQPSLPLIPVISSSVYARNLVVRTLPWHPTASAKATAVCSSGHSPTEIRSHSPSVQWIASVI